MEATRKHALATMAKILAALMLVGGLIPLAALTWPQSALAVDQTISGTCQVTCVNGDGEADLFDVVMPDGTTLRGHCLDHGLPAPADGTYQFAGSWNGSAYDVVLETQSASLYPGQIDVGAGCQRVGGFTWHPQGRIELQKVSADNTFTNDSNCYSLEGAHYLILSEDGTVADELTTDATGWAQSDLLPVGTYRIEESVPSPGYLADTELATSTVTVEPGKTAVVHSVEPPLYDTTGITVVKADAETGESTPLGNASLALAEYTFRFYGGIYETAAEAEASGEALRTWTLRTDESGSVNLTWADRAFEYRGETFPYLVSGDELYRDSAGSVIVPLGTLVITETVAPEGYLLADDSFAVQITQQGDSVTHMGNMPNPVSEQVIRGDLEFVKARETDQARLANVPFVLESLTTKEKHVIVTDENGFASTAASFNAHASSTNANDAVLDGGTTNAQAGIWFGETGVNDTAGALPYDTYRLEELPCAANEGLELITIDAISITRDNYVVSLGTFDNQPGEEPTKPQLATEAVDADDGDHTIAATGEVHVVDHVAYEGLTPGQTYELRGTIVNKATGAEVSAESEVVKLTPSAENGSADMAFTFDATEAEGDALVAFERLYLNDELVAEHADLNSEAQTVYRETEQPEPPASSDNPAPAPNSSLPQTGDSDIMLVLAALALGATAATALAVRHVLHKG